MTGLDLRALLAALTERQVRFVVVGGVAVAAHGYVRATADLDIVPDSEPGNLDHLVSALIDLKATLPVAAERPLDATRDREALRHGRNLTLTTRYGALDIVQLARGVPAFAALDAQAVDAELLGVPVRVCSLGHLREMKAARASPADQADLANLPDT